MKLPLDLSLTPDMVQPVWAIGVAMFALGIYWVIAQSKGLEARFKKTYGEADYSRPWVLFCRLIGFVLMGVSSLLVILFVFDKSPTEFGINLDFSGKTLMYSGILIAILVPINLLTAGKPANLAMYPQIRVKKWSKMTIVQSTLGWLMYLLGYEILYRGILLYSTLIFGIWPAIAINTCVYSVAHIHKGPGETFGAIPFGIVICLITLQTGSITTAVIAHMALAMSNEWVALRAQPDMKVI